LPGAWAVRLRFETGDRLDPFNYIGVHPSALDGADAFDLLEDPWPSGVPRLVLVDADGGTARDADIRQPDPDGVLRWDVRLQSDESRLGAMLAWDWTSELPRSIAVVLVDPRTSRIVDLDRNHAMRIDIVGGETVSLVALAGPRERVLAVADAELPAPPPRLVVAAPFPNPFHDGVRIDYAVSDGGSTDIRVYDPAGRLVMVRSFAGPSIGAHSFVWDGRDTRGRSVAAGVYFLEVTSGKWREERRLVRVSAPESLRR
jgi:hypothetical protein